MHRRTAVSIEDLTFPDINDYLQYADQFFMNQNMQFLGDDPYSILNYTNSLVFIYLYKFAAESPGIAFLNHLFYNNYRRPTPFHENIRSTSVSLGKTWPELLNSFHTASFFSGSRADTARFLNDANLFGQWYYKDAPTASNSVKKSFDPYAMQSFYLAPQSSHGDTLIAILGGTTAQSSTNIGKTWAASMILRKQTGDSIAPVTLDSQGNGFLIIPDWKNSEELIFVVTNGHPSQKLDYTVSFQFCPVTYTSDSIYNISAASSDSQSFASVLLDTKSDLRCPLEITIQSNKSILDSAREHSLKPLSSTFQLSYPLFWSNEQASDSVSIALFINIPLKSIFQYDSVSIYKWNQSSLQWDRTTSVVTDTTDTLKMKLGVSEPGIYAVFTPVDTKSEKIVAYPNPIRKSKHRIVKFDGGNISEIRIYNISGALIFRSFEKEWNLKNNNGRDIIPGLYTAIIVFQSETGSKPATVYRKILVAP